MKRFMILPLLTFALACAGMVCAADEQTVIVPVEGKPCQVKQTDVVRVTASGISGSKVDVNVDGPAKVVAKTNVVKRSGGNPLIGAFQEEYDIKPSGAGAVKIKVTVTPPQPDAKAIVTEYELEVK